MNKVVLMGRLTKDPEIRYSSGQQESIAIGRYTLAVDRRVRNNNEQAADFIPIVAFGKAAEFAEKFLHRGTKLLVTGRIQTGSYTNKDGQKVYTTEVVAEDQEFCESKTTGHAQSSQSSQNPTDGFMNVPPGIEDDLPFR